MPVAGASKKGKAAAAANPVAEESADFDINDLGLDSLDFSLVGNPDAVPSTEAVDVPWEDDSPDVPGEEDLTIDDLRVPGDEAATVLAEFLPPIRASLEVLQGQVSDFHEANKKREQSNLVTYKALSDSINNRIDTLESSIHELVAQFRLFVQASAGKAEAPATGGASSKPEKPATKAPEAPKKPTLAEIGAKLKINPPRDLPTILSALKGMPEGRTMTLDKLRDWLVSPKVGLTQNQADKIIEMTGVKGPVDAKTFFPD